MVARLMVKCRDGDEVLELGTLLDSLGWRHGKRGNFPLFAAWAKAHTGYTCTTGVRLEPKDKRFTGVCDPGEAMSMQELLGLLQPNSD